MSTMSDGNMIKLPYKYINNPNEFFSDYLEKNYKGEVNAADMLELKNIAVNDPIFLTYCVTNHDKTLPFNISLLYMTTHMFTEDFYSEYSTLTYDKSIPITSMLLDWLHDLPYYDILSDYNRVHNIFNNIVSIRDLKSEIMRDVKVSMNIMTTTHVTISSVIQYDDLLTREELEIRHIFDEDSNTVVPKVIDYMIEHINGEVGIKTILLSLIAKENNFQEFKSVFRYVHTGLCCSIEDDLDISIDDNLVTAIGKTIHYICNIVLNDILIKNLDKKITYLIDNCTLSEILYDVFQINRNITQITKMEWSDIYEN